MPPGVELPPEGVESFADNAAGKAVALAELVLGDPAQVSLLEGMTSAGREWRDELLFLADDSGLEVEALGWAPGVTSARYAGGGDAGRVTPRRAAEAVGGWAVVELLTRP